MLARSVAEKYISESAVDPDSSSKETQKNGLTAKTAGVHWKHPARPAAAEPSVVQNLRVKVDHEHNQPSIRLWAGFLTAPGKISGN
jgi:hypothetical protein